MNNTAASIKIKIFKKADVINSLVQCMINKMRKKRKKISQILVNIQGQNISDGHGFRKPHRYTGKGTEDTGQGTELKTLEKP